jgi:hypothetical protein
MSLSLLIPPPFSINLAELGNNTGSANKPLSFNNAGSSNNNPLGGNNTSRDYDALSSDTLNNNDVLNNNYGSDTVAVQHEPVNDFF